MMTVRVLCLFVAVAMLAGVSPAQVTAEIPVSQPQYGPAPSDQFAPVVGSDGANFLVAWLDGRAMPPSLYANRVTRDGHVLDGTGIRIPVESSAANQRLLGVFRTDGAYTLVCSYQLFNPSMFRTAMAVIGDDGQLVDVRIVDDFWGRAAASNGSRVVLASETEIIVLDGRAKVLDRFPSPSKPAYGVSLASNGSTFLLGTFVYDGVNSVPLIALDANGRPTGATIIPGGASGDGPLIGSDGVDYLVMYGDVRSGGSVVHMVSAQAELRATTTLDARGTALLWTGRNYLMALTTDPQQQIALVMLDRSGAIAGPARALGAGTPGAVNQPGMARNGTSALVTWTSGSQEGPNGWEVAGQFVNADGVPTSSAMTIPTASTPQVAPVIAAGGTNDLVAWVEPIGIYAARMTRDGTSLDGPGIVISSQTIPSRSLTLGIAPALRAIFDGVAYLIAWTAADGVKAQRVNPETGTLIGPRLVLTTCATSFDLGRDDTGLILAASDCSDRHLYVERIDAAGAIGAPLPISPAGMLSDVPRVAWSGSEWLVVWNELIHLPIQFDFYRGNVYAARLSRALTPLDTQPLAIAVSDFDESTPLVATDGREFLVVWSHRSYDAAAGLYLRRIHIDGSTGATSSAINGWYEAQSIVWDGARYNIAYDSNADYWNHDLFLTHAGTREEQPPLRDQIPISASESDERYVALATTATMHVRAAYTRVATEPLYGGVSRVFVRDTLSARRRTVRPR